jgi:hypothetical protein
MIEMCAQFVTMQMIPIPISVTAASYMQHMYQEYGNPRQCNAGKGERGLKDWAKSPAKTA